MTTNLFPFSFSGADVRAFVTPSSNNTGFYLDTLATISFQVNEQKSPVRRMGRPNVVGFTKSIRTIAGTMVLIILRDHPAHKIIDNSKYHKLGMTTDTKNSSGFFATKKPFDLKLVYQSEDQIVGIERLAADNEDYHSEFNIYGIEIISQSITTSINDMMTEVVVQFMAKDYEEFKYMYKDKDKEVNNLDNLKQTNNKLWARVNEINKLIDAGNLSQTTKNSLEAERNEIMRTIMEYYAPKIVELNKESLNTNE